MSQVQVKPARNQSIECARLIASFFVVFIHCPFPGITGRLVTAVARFAVPLFFIISGFFSSNIGEDKIARRVHHVLWLNVGATVLYAIWRVVREVCLGESLLFSALGLIPTAEEIVKWALLNVNPYAGHLWYLASLWVCYVVLWGYVRFNGQRNNERFYSSCLYLFVLQFVLGELAPILNVSVLYMLYRNALLTGLPMFGLGMFLGEYRERLLELFALHPTKLVTIALLGAGSSVLCAFGLGGVDLPLGMVMAVAALMLLLASVPRLSKQGGFMEICVSHFGGLSAAVYILHLMIVGGYEIFCLPLAIRLFGSLEGFLRPLLVLGITLTAAFVLEQVLNLAKRFHALKR